MKIINNVGIIAEVKTQSPFGWKSDKNWDELFMIANKIGNIITGASVSNLNLGMERNRIPF